MYPDIVAKLEVQFGGLIPQMEVSNESIWLLQIFDAVPYTLSARPEKSEQQYNSFLPGYV